MAKKKQMNLMGNEGEMKESRKGKEGQEGKEGHEGDGRVGFSVPIVYIPSSHVDKKYYFKTLSEAQSDAH